MPGPKPTNDLDPMIALTKRPYLAGDAVEKTWSFVWPSVTPEQGASQAARLAEFFNAEVMRLEKLA